MKPFVACFGVAAPASYFRFSEVRDYIESLACQEDCGLDEEASCISCLQSKNEKTVLQANVEDHNISQAARDYVRQIVRKGSKLDFPPEPYILSDCKGTRIRNVFCSVVSW